MKVAYPGTFNPWHNGHQYVYERLCSMFGRDDVYVTPAINPTKQLSMAQKTVIPAMINAAIDNKTNIVMTTDTIVTTCKTLGIGCIARGIRSGQDATNEFTMADWNLDRGLNTVFIYCGAELRKLSSSALRELHSFGEDISKYMPAGAHGVWLKGN